MTKRRELSEKDSCFNKADMSETIFVLLGRDPAAPAAIRAWCQRRVELHKNTWVDSQIQEAMITAQMIEDLSKNISKNISKK
jgi:hypothetical protein